MSDTQVKLFDNKNIRTQWDEKQEKWYFSIVDVVAALTDSDYQHARNYWKVLKNRLKAEGNQSVTNCNQLKMIAPDGKFYNTDVADTKANYAQYYTYFYCITNKIMPYCHYKGI